MSQISADSSFENELRSFGWRQRELVSVAELVERIRSGEDITLEEANPVVVLEDGWESRLCDMVDQARRRGEPRLKDELEVLGELFRFQDRCEHMGTKVVLGEANKIAHRARHQVSRPVASFVLGSLGVVLLSRGLLEDGMLFV